MFLELDFQNSKRLGEIRNVPVLNQNAVAAADLLSRTRNMRRQTTILQSKNAEKQVEERLSVLVSTLYSGLKDEVFDEQAVTTIGHTKTVLNLPDIACRLKGPYGGHIMIAVTQGLVFVNAVRAVPVRSLNVVPDDDLTKQYREFLKRLEESTRQYSIEEQREIDPKDILKLFFEPESCLFVDTEIVMRAISSVCCVKIPCESVLESLVSAFENHFDPRRNMKEESTTEQFMIAVNGPSLGHADAVIREAMNSYWKSKAQKRGGSTSSTSWHFFGRVVEQLKENSGGSKVLNRMLTGHSRLTFMDT